MLEKNSSHNFQRKQYYMSPDNLKKIDQIMKGSKIKISEATIVRRAIDSYDPLSEDDKFWLELAQESVKSALIQSEITLNSVQSAIDNYSGRT